MTKEPTIPGITIGVPCFNEGRNITKLLKDLLSQKGILISKIIVYSDGSTDDTKLLAEKIKDNRISVIDTPQRKGIATGLNKIIANSKTDFLVTLDGDININDLYFINKLTKPLLLKGAQLTSSRLEENKTRNFFETSLKTSMSIKNQLFSIFKKGQNIYNCHGPARAYSKSLYKKIFFPISVGNDMYSYLFCISNNMKFKYVPEAIIYYQLPKNFNDHKNQSMRFENAISLQKKYFDNKLVEKEMKIPIYFYIISLAKTFHIIVRYPIHLIFYLGLQLYIKLLKPLTPTNEIWKIAESTKKI